MAEPGNNSLRILLVGKAGNGKSSTGNTILGKQSFQCKFAAQAVTQTCQKACREWKGRELEVVDTPGLFDTKESLETTCNEISRCVLYSCPGPHAIIVVLQLGHFTEEEQKTVALIKAFFGEAAVKHMVVLFTRKDHLENVNLNDFVAEEGDKLKTFIKECGNRYLAFNNKANKAEKEAQVQELVELIDTMVQNNGGSYFPDAMYKDCEETLKKRVDDLKTSYTNKREEERRQVEEEYAQKQDKLRQEKEEKLKSNERKYEEKMRNIRKEAENNVFAQILDAVTNILSTVWHFFQK